MKKALKIVMGVVACNFILNAGHILGETGPIVCALLEGRDNDAEMLMDQYYKMYEEIDLMADATGMYAVDIANIVLKLKGSKQRFKFVRR